MAARHPADFQAVATLTELGHFGRAAERLVRDMVSGEQAEALRRVAAANLTFAVGAATTG